MVGEGVLRLLGGLKGMNPVKVTALSTEQERASHVGVVAASNRHKRTNAKRHKPMHVCSVRSWADVPRDSVD